MLVSAKEMLTKAKAGKYAVGQFNTCIGCDLNGLVTGPHTLQGNGATLTRLQLCWYGDCVASVCICISCISDNACCNVNVIKSDICRRCDAYPVRALSFTYNEEYFYFGMGYGTRAQKEYEQNGMVLSVKNPL